MRIHVVGVAGSGMGSLAGLLVELGHDVTGSDVAFDPPMGPSLVRWGIECLHGFSAAHLSHRPDLVVIGNVCRSDNVEARAAIDGGYETTHIAGALSRFVLKQCVPLVVAGTHGKTTTTALCAWILDACGARPGFLVGGVPANFERGFRSCAPGAPFVIEGDEYDTAFFEKTAKFLHYGARVAIVTSIEHDHVDIYPTFESYLEAFARFVEGLPEDGLLVANLADEHVVSLARSARCRVVYYGAESERGTASLPDGAEVWTLTGYEPAPGRSLLRVTLPDGRTASTTSSLLGAHNARNAVAALVAAHVGYGADLDAALGSLESFRGIKRRQELLGEPRGVYVYDDFAHHPTAVAVTLDALRAHHPAGTLFAVFEPRSATACRNMHQSAYPRSFDAADVVMLAPLGRTGLSEVERLDTERVCSDLRARGKDATAMPSVDSIIERLSGRAAPGDVIALLSNGAFGGIHGKLIEAIERG